MHRRTFLAGAAAISLSGCVSSVDNSLGEAVNASSGVINSDSEPGVYEFGSLSPGFERAEWIDGILEITFSDDHDMDLYGIRYVSKSDPKDDLVLEEAPEYGGVAEVDLLSAMSKSQPPTGTYHIYAYRANVGIIVDITEVIGNVSFNVTPVVEVESVGLVDDTNLSLQLTNNGNAPVYLDSISASQRVSLREVLEMGESTTVRPENTLFKQDEDCIVVPMETIIDVDTAPQTDTSFTFTSGYEEEKRYCEVSY